MLEAPVLEALVLEYFLALVLLILVLIAPVLLALVLAPVLQAICYKHQCIASGTVTVLFISSVCYGISDMSIGNGSVFACFARKLAPAGEN